MLVSKITRIDFASVGTLGSGIGISADLAQFVDLLVLELEGETGLHIRCL